MSPPSHCWQGKLKKSSIVSNVQTVCNSKCKTAHLMAYITFKMDDRSVAAYVVWLGYIFDSYADK